MIVVKKISFLVHIMEIIGQFFFIKLLISYSVVIQTKNDTALELSSGSVITLY